MQQSIRCWKYTHYTVKSGQQKSSSSNVKASLRIPCSKTSPNEQLHLISYSLLTLLIEKKLEKKLAIASIIDDFGQTVFKRHITWYLGSFDHKSKSIQKLINICSFYHTVPVDFFGKKKGQKEKNNNMDKHISMEQTSVSSNNKLSRRERRFSTIKNELSNKDWDAIHKIEKETLDGCDHKDKEHVTNALVRAIGSKNMCEKHLKETKSRLIELNHELRNIQTKFRSAQSRIESLQRVVSNYENGKLNAENESLKNKLNEINDIDSRRSQNYAKLIFHVSELQREILQCDSIEKLIALQSKVKQNRKNGNRNYLK